MQQFPNLITANTETLWGGVLAESLRRAGLRRVVISPGSSSTPLALGFYLNKGLKAHVVLDERVAAFFALGLAKALEEPVVLICTSGTAAANYFPVLVEARMSGVPLIILTADRPAELRYGGGEQVIDQQRLYGHMPVWYRELPLPRPAEKLFRVLRDQAVYAYERACFPSPGPVHLNVPFPYPVVPKPDGSDEYERLLAKVADEHFFVSITAIRPPGLTGDEMTAKALFEKLKGYNTGCITVGAQQGFGRATLADDVAAIAQALGWPVLVDGIAPLRGEQGKIPGMVAHYDIILRNAVCYQELRPEAVLHIGRLPTSKTLRSWLDEGQAEAFHVEPTGEFVDPYFRGINHVRVSPHLLAEVVNGERQAFSDYAIRWKALDEKVAEGINAAFIKEERLFESKIPWMLSQALPAQTPWFVSTSMAIRECEAFMLATDKRFNVFCNRGANGLDGLIATSYGMAEGAQKPSLLLIGDLGFLHDQGALLLNQNGFSGSLTILCVDNDGGTIFRHLGVATCEGVPLKELWLTPQVADICALGRAHGIEVICPETWEAVEAAVQVLPEKRTRLIYFKTNGADDFDKRKALIKGLVDSLD